MLGSSADAEDAVQDAWIRWQSQDHAAVFGARAWLSTALMRICIDRLTSARARRKTYPGTWLPEPVLTASPIDLEWWEWELELTPHVEKRMEDLR